MTDNDFLIGQGQIQGQGQGQASNDPVPPYYTKMSEGFRKGAPPALQCALFCGGGRRCPYESRQGFWPLESTALPPLYSHWVTEDVLAMSRLNVPLIDQGILQQFNKLSIKSVINLQVPGEHSSCSPTPLHSSGFSYDPTQLMDNGIYFYNYAWRDYGETSIGLILDMVKVLAFGVTLGKVAVHCHAGLGRTGVLISCYLVYSHRLRANEAMRFVRIRRPGSVQSRLQILSVQQFEQYILPHTTVFCNRDLLKDKKQAVDFTLGQGLKRQRFLAHGLEVKTLRNIPKILNVVCERFLRLCGRPGLVEMSVEDSENRWRVLEMTIIQTDGIDTDLDASSNGTSSPIPTQNLYDLESPKMERAISAKTCYSPEEIARGLLYDHVRMAEGLAKYFKQYRLELNQKGPGVWVRLAQERNLYVLSALMFFWLEHLRQPIIGPEELTTIVLQDDHKVTLKKLPLEAATTLEYLMHFIANLALPEGSELRGRLLMRFGAALTHRIVYGKNGQVIHQGYHMVLERPPEKPKPRKLNEGTLSKLMALFEGIIQEKLTTISSSDQEPKEPKELEKSQQ